MMPEAHLIEQAFYVNSDLLDDVEDWCRCQHMDVWEQSITIGDNGSESEVWVYGTVEQLTLFKLRWQ